MSPPLNPVIVIPARLASTRLPGKPLADIHGEAMIVHVWRRAVAAGVGPVVVACGDREIADVIEAAGGRAVMTRPDHPSGSDRVFEAVEAVDPEGRHDIVVNLQGDAPDLRSSEIKAVIAPFNDNAVEIATIAAPITSDSERHDPNVVKVEVAVSDGAMQGRALNFSRAAVLSGDGPLYHHIGLYAFRRAALARFIALPEGVLERRERLEQLRALEAQMRIDVALIDRIPLEVNTPADLEHARAVLQPRRPS